ncbi:MAG TPA: ABC transporter permease [Alphaproteobacteria bacterium]|nr:ABC transporter permease [Alphaproteobacteria bacterium]
MGALEVGFLYGLVAIGVLLSFRILDFPDLTVDGSLPLGAAVCAILIVSGVNPWLATFCSILAGMAAGFTTAWISVRWNILHLLASILTMTALYSINLRIMGRPNIALLGEQTIFTPLENFTSLESFSYLRHYTIPAAMCIIATVVLIVVYRFLSSEKGLAMRATGANPRMAKAQGIAVNRQVLLGIAISNGLVALAGALWAQSQGFADVTMGVGTIVVGLAAVIVGEAFFNPKVILSALVACILGSIFYRLAIAFALNASFLGLQAQDLQLVTAIIVGLAMITPKLRSKILDFKASRSQA